jgi:hypothetical protein
VRFEIVRVVFEFAVLIEIEFFKFDAAAVMLSTVETETD